MTDIENQFPQPKAKKTKIYNPHIDGKGPSLLGDWKKQIFEEEKAELNSLKIAVWNVNGLRAILRSTKNSEVEDSDLLAYMREEDPDLMCLNETKCDQSVIENFSPDPFKDWETHFVHSTKKKGYAGVGLLIKKTGALHGKLEKIIEGVGNEEHDLEGRSITAIFSNLVVVCSYVANAGQQLVRLKYRVESFDPAMKSHLEKMREEFKPRAVIWCGDLNCAYDELDIWNSRNNQKSAGHTPQERASFGKIVNSKEWMDLWRISNPLERRYTFWPARSLQARKENLGWRLDYFVASSNLDWKNTKVLIRDKTKGSDHCPLVLVIKNGDEKKDLK